MKFRWDTGNRGGGGAWITKSSVDPNQSPLIKALNLPAEHSGRRTYYAGRAHTTITTPDSSSNMNATISIATEKSFQTNYKLAPGSQYKN